MGSALATRAVRISLPNGTATMTVVDDTGLPIAAVEQYLNYLRTIDSSPNTIKAYAGHLSLLFRWLAGRGADWEQLTFDELCLFVQDLTDGTLRSLQRPGTERPATPRSRSTVEAVLAAVHSFYAFWQFEGRGPADLKLYRDTATNGRAKHHFLGHVEMRRHGQQRRIRLRGPKSKGPKLIDFEAAFEGLLACASTHRDRLLISALYDGGLRIGQALGLRHSDLDLARRRIAVERRRDNSNGALSKQRRDFTIDMPERFFTLYSRALVEEQLALGIDSDYLFVNLVPRQQGRPMTYSNAAQVIAAIGRRAGIEVTPHMLRHTHATMLAKSGWSAPEIAARLGQSSNSSADVYIHLSQNDISEKYAATIGSR